MDMLDASRVTGDQIVLKRTDPRHFTIDGTAGPLGEENKEKSFGDMMFEAVNGTNVLQQKSSELAKEMIINPDGVDPHDVTVTLMKARTSLALTKAVTDNAIRAYKEIISIR